MADETDLGTALWEAVRTPGVPSAAQVAGWIREFYKIPGNQCGGSLHIITDDFNIEDHHVTWCEGYACGKGDEVGMHLARLLGRQSKTQRLKAVRSRRDDG